ncbi:MAG: hypothetical protein V3U30_05005 [Thermoplasmata archaeon]
MTVSNEDPRLVAHERAEKITEAIAGPEGKPSHPRVPGMKMKVRPGSWNLLRSGGRLSIDYVVETHPGGTPGDPPRAYQARFDTNLGHAGVTNRPHVLGRVVGSPRSQCGDFREYPARRRIHDIFQAAWNPIYDIPSFEVRGHVVCGRSRLGHVPHPALVRFAGLQMEEIGVHGLGARPEPKETSLATPPERGPTAEEVLDEAVRARAAGE